jgi:hypothetical protein
MRALYSPILFIQQRPRTDGSSSSDGPLDKILLQTANLLLERLDLLPAIQRPPVVCPQAGNNRVLGFAEVSIGLLQLLPLGQLGTQLLDLLVHDAVAHVLLSLLLGERRRGGCRIREPLDKGGLAGLLGLAGEGFAEFGEVLGLLLAQLLQLGGQALLVLQFLLS